MMRGEFAVSEGSSQDGSALLPREILKKVRRIEIITRRYVTDAFAGEYSSVFRGRGMDFAEVREYTPGDDVRLIDWNVSARMRRLYVKKFREERELTIMLLVDISGSLRFGSVTWLKREMVAELAAVLAMTALRNNDKVGLIMFTDCIERFVPPRKGRKHILRLVRDILVVEPSSQRTDISTALAFLNRVQRRRAVIFLISDFHDQAGVHALKVAARHHDLLALMVSDPLEQSLPSIGWVRFEDAETGEQVLVNTSDKRFRQRFAALVDQHRQFWRQLFQSAQIDYVELSTNEPYIIPLWRMFRERHRRFRR